MKKLLLLLTLMVSSLLVKSQTTRYRAVTTELYSYNSTKETWDLYKSNENTDILIVVEENFVTIQAQTPSMFRVYSESKEPLKSKSLYGYRYRAKDLRTEDYVKIDIMTMDDGPYVLLSIINMTEGLNYRYFLNKSK
jgi:hypothetical protein